MRRIAIISVSSFLLTAAAPVAAPADIFRWDNGQVIPGTEGIAPGPGVQLDHRDLRYARLADVAGLDLTGANFEASILVHALL